MDVLVGFDGTATAYEALLWAACEAGARDTSLRVMSCSTPPAEVDFYRAGELQTHCLERAVESLQRRFPPLSVSMTTTHLDPRDALVEAARTASVLVLGASTHGTAHAMLLGSVTRSASRTSPCPVVIVRGTGLRPVRTITVGVDGSSASGIALDWSCAEATVRGAGLRLVHVADGSTSACEAEALLQRAIDECAERTHAPVTGVVRRGEPADVLIDLSHETDLIAIGSRGRSGFKTSLFGSVALSVADAGACPVLITHPGLRAPIASGLGDQRSDQLAE